MHGREGLTRHARLGKNGPAFRDSSLKQAPCTGRPCEQADGHAAGGLPEDRDTLGIAAEVADVVLNPGERRQHVLQAVISGRGGEEAERSQAIADAHQHDAALGQNAAVIDRRRRFSDCEGAAVNPDHDRAFLAGIPRCGPHVQVEAVLAGGRGVLRPIAAGGGHLCTGRGESVRLPEATPGDPGLRRAPPERSGRRRRVGNALEGGNPVCGDPRQLASRDGGSLNHGPGRRCEQGKDQGSQCETRTIVHGGSVRSCVYPMQQLKRASLEQEELRVERSKSRAERPDTLMAMEVTAHVH